MEISNVVVSPMTTDTDAATSRHPDQLSPSVENLHDVELASAPRARGETASAAVAALDKVGAEVDNGRSLHAARIAPNDKRRRVKKRRMASIWDGVDIPVLVSRLVAQHLTLFRWEQRP